jgi:hypothetical protein
LLLTIFNCNLLCLLNGLLGFNSEFGYVHDERFATSLSTQGPKPMFGKNDVF